ncbi:endonuclease NucS domain-containing protein [Nocardioides daphniae]|uniref:DUF91 domain-containing protein n=1 Tax=Nocardioides daphniae TaxID=402297 RepID=A0A4P7UEW7_9ACTN|nr:endonuclease NucS domain-containing protein [Nocardioides daphniae]QCC77419.1 DUF91 domain-containing protein [Nocardioides daphniae]GGD24437.1 hypothetical protein GCM10007231_24510 [Nocardioides daphniae]
MSLEDTENAMRRIEEDIAVLQTIEAVTGASRERTATVVAALRDAIDGLFLDGYTIFAPPFSLTYASDPVAPVFAARIDDASDADIEAWNLGDMEATAQWLGIPLPVYLRHPVASDLRVLIDLLDALGIDDADGPEGMEAVAIAEAWFDTFAQERRYRLSSVGLERDLEAWVVHHTECLLAIGYDVQLKRQQFVLPDRRRPDLVFDLVESDGSPGTLIVELKATGGYLEAVDQLVGYLDAFRSLGLANGVLRGLLVADGFPHDVLQYADERGIDTATLAELGYRKHLAGLPVTTPHPSPLERPTTTDRTDIMTEGTKADVPAYYLAWGPSPYDHRAYESDAPTPEPFLRLTARSLSDAVIEVEPVGLPGWEHEDALKHLSEGPLTPRELGLRFGGSCYLLPANAAAERQNAARDTTRSSQRRVASRRSAPEGESVSKVPVEDMSATEVASIHTILFSDQPALANDPTHATPAVWIIGETGLPPSQISFVGRSPVALALTAWAEHEARRGQTVGQIIETFRGIHTEVVEGRIPPAPSGPSLVSDLIGADQDLIPLSEETTALNVQTMEAATAFMRAAGMLRKHLTYLPPRELANWLRRTPEELQGDDELPDHIHAAADALEGLSTVLVGVDVPSNYDGHAREFLQDAARIFTSVARRLGHIAPR